VDFWTDAHKAIDNQGVKQSKPFGLRGLNLDWFGLLDFETGKLA
jgi:hypothetical protein